MRTEMNVHPAKKTSMIIETADRRPLPERTGLSGKVRLCHRRDLYRKVRGQHRRHGAGVHPRRPRLYPHDGADRPREGAGPPEQGKGQGREGTGHVRATSWPTPSSWSVPRRLWWRRSAQSAPRARTSWPTSSRASRLWANADAGTESTHLPVAHRVAGDLYLCPHRLHRVHLLQLSCRSRIVSEGASGRVLGILQAILRHLGPSRCR